MSERVTFIAGGETGRLAIVDIVGDRFPVFPRRPESLVRLFAKETLSDGRVLGTGQRTLPDNTTRNVAWWADADEVARIDREWREAIARSSFEVVDTTFEEFAD